MQFERSLLPIGKIMMTAILASSVQTQSSLTVSLFLDSSETAVVGDSK